MSVFSDVNNELDRLIARMEPRNNSFPNVTSEVGLKIVVWVAKCGHVVVGLLIHQARRALRCTAIESPKILREKSELHVSRLIQAQLSDRLITFPGP